MGQVDSNEPRIENKESNKTISLQIWFFFFSH
jgi:hypothetical protein